MRPISDTPAYVRISDKLRDQIEHGIYGPGARLPTVQQLGDEYGVSSRTAFEALKLLQGEGLILSKAGTPAIVREPAVVVWLGRSWRPDAPVGSPWRAQLAAEGRVGAWQAHSEKSKAPSGVAARLRIEPGAPVMRTEYVFLADGHRIYLSTSWEPWDLVGGTAVTLPEAGPHAGKGVADRMAIIGYVPVRVAHDVAPSTLTAPEAARLELRPGIPVTRVERTYEDGERPLETADIVVPSPHRVRFEIPLEQHADTPGVE